MSGVLTAFVVVVGALGVLNLLLSLAIVRRLRARQDSQVWRPAADDLTPLGTVLGSFALPTVHGGAMTDAELRSGPAFVGLVQAGCPACGRFVDQVVRGELHLPDRSLVVVVRRAGDDGGYPDRLAGATRVAVTDVDVTETAFGPVGAFPTFLRFDDGVVTAADYRAEEVLAAFDAVPADR